MAAKQMKRADIEGKARVKHPHAELEGTVIEVGSPYYWKIRWDDGTEGAVHPQDVIHLTLDIEYAPPIDSRQEGAN